MIDDYFVAIVPDNVDINDVGSYDSLLKMMERQANAAVLDQYGARRPRAIAMERTHWLVTNSPDEVDAFQPDHDCDECRAGNRRAREFLLANPGKFVACANLHYEELW